MCVFIAYWFIGLVECMCCYDVFHVFVCVGPLPLHRVAERPARVGRGLREEDVEVHALLAVLVGDVPHLRLCVYIYI